MIQKILVVITPDANLVRNGQNIIYHTPGFGMPVYVIAQEIQFIFGRIEMCVFQRCEERIKISMDITYCQSSQFFRFLTGYEIKYEHKTTKFRVVAFFVNPRVPIINLKFTKGGLRMDL